MKRVEFQQLGSLIHDVSRLSRTALDRWLLAQGTTLSRWRVLTALLERDKGGPTQGELAHSLRLSEAAIGGLLDRLQDSDIVERRQDSADRRHNRIHLTAKGHRLARTMRDVGMTLESRFFAGITGDRQQSVAEVLDQMKRNLLVLCRHSREQDGDNASGHERR